MEIYNEENTFDICRDPNMEENDDYYVDEEIEDEYYDDDDETMSKGSWESSSKDKEDDYEDDLYYCPTTDMKTRPTFSQDLMKIKTIMKTKSYLDKKPVIEVVEEIVTTSVAPWKDFQTEEVADFNEIVKDTEEKQKIIEAVVVVEEEEYDLRRLVRRNDDVKPRHNNKPFPKPTPTPPGEIDKTRLCKFGKRCVSQKKCDRVHTFDAWEPNMCHYDKKCRIIRKCRFLHTRETKEDYLKRIIQQEDNRFYYGNQHLYLKNFGIQLKTDDNDKE